MAPNSQAWMHQPQPSHFFSSTTMMPVSEPILKAPRRHDATHAGFSHKRHASGTLTKGSILVTWIRDIRGLKAFSFRAEQANWQISQPVHF
jgi:hypothetical protein